MNRTVFERSAPHPALVDQVLGGSRAQCLWTEQAPGERFGPLPADTTCDLVVVGGGYAGLWTALLARRRDPSRRVVLVEARTVGWAASGRNGGFVEASLTHGEDNGRARWPEAFDDLEALGAANLDGFERDLAELGIDASFERTGAISVAVEPYQAQELAAQRDRLGTAYLDAQQVRAHVDSPTYLAGVLDAEGSALVHPARLAAGLARACAELGVEIHEQTRVTRLDTPGTGRTRCRVETDRGVVTAAQVALATNVFPSLLGRNRLMTVPVYDYVIATEPLSAEQLGRIGWQGREGLADMANQFHYYRLTPDDRIVFGGYDAIYHSGAQVRSAYEERPETYRRLTSHLLTTFPQLEDVRVSHRWAGAIDTCTRFCAFHGVARGGRVAYSAGYTGLGVGATRFGAEVMLDLLDGRSTPRTENAMVRSRPLPFPPEPAASLGINATRWSLDRADHRDGRRNLFLRTLDGLGLGFDS